MEPDNTHDHSLQPPKDAPSARSGYTTPDLIADEKDRQTDPNILDDEEKASQSAKDPVASDTPEIVYATGKQLIPVLLALICAVLLVALDMTIIGTAIPKITDEFHGLSQVAWYGSAYFMTFGGFQPASGKLFRFFPLKTSFLATIFLFMIGSLICAVAQDSTTFIIGRAVAGVGASGVATGAFTIVAIVAEPKIRPGLIGLMGATYGISSVLGPILGGVFTDRVTWRWCFYLNLPVGGLSLILIFLFFRTPPQAAPVKATWKERLIHLDFPGVALVMAGIISFILACQYGGQSMAWNSSTVIGLFVGSGLIWIAFVAWEYYFDERAMLPRRIMGLRYVWQPSAFQFFFAATYFVLLYYLPVYFQSIHNKSAIGSGVLNLPMVLAVTFGSITSGSVVTKTGYPQPFQIVGAAIGLVATGLIYTYNIDTGLGKWIGYQIIYGYFVGMSFQMGITLAQGLASMEDMSIVSAAVLFFQTIGGAFAISAAQSGFVNRIITTLAKTAPQINPQKVIATGATQIRNAFSAQEAPLVIEAYMAGIRVTWILAVVLSAVAVLLVVFVPIKKVNAQQAGAAA